MRGVSTDGARALLWRGHRVRATLVAWGIDVLLVTAFPADKTDEGTEGAPRYSEVQTQRGKREAQSSELRASDAASRRLHHDGQR